LPALSIFLPNQWKIYRSSSLDFSLYPFKQLETENISTRDENCWKLLKIDILIGFSFQDDRKIYYFYNLSMISKSFHKNNILFTLLCLLSEILLIFINTHITIIIRLIIDYYNTATLQSILNNHGSLLFLTRRNDFVAIFKNLARSKNNFVKSSNWWAMLRKIFFYILTVWPLCIIILIVQQN